MDKLLIDVKNYLDITWQDEGTDKKLIEIIKRGEDYLKEISGNPSLDFSEESPSVRGLLFDYCRYVWSGAPEIFETNFRSDLLRLRITGEVKAFETETAAD